MIDQEKREKVIKGLEHCIDKMDTVVNKRHGFNCVECTYYRKCENIGSLVGLPLMRDALALLKAQEPRVITDDDFIGNPNMDSQGFLPAWIEYRRDGEWFECWDDTDDEWSSVTAGNYKGEGYRCWTSRPTDEQREAVKWG